MRVRVKYFASLREKAKKSEEEIEVDSPDLNLLYQTLDERYGFNLSKENIKAVINSSYVEWNQKINENDQVVFIPPVAGG